MSSDQSSNLRLNVFRQTDKLKDVHDFVTTHASSTGSLAIPGYELRDDPNEQAIVFQSNAYAQKSINDLIKPASKLRWSTRSDTASMK